MDMKKQMSFRKVKASVMIAVSFVFLALMIKLWQTGSVHSAIKVLTIGAYCFCLRKLFTNKELATFAGYSVMMLGLNYIWIDKDLANIWKIGASIAVMLQLGTLQEDTDDISEKRHSR